MMKSLLKRTTAVVAGVLLCLTVWAGNGINVKAVDYDMQDLIVRLGEGKLVFLFPGVDTIETNGAVFKHRYYEPDGTRMNQ